MVCPTLLIDHSKYFAVFLIGLNLPDISTQPAGLERCEQYIIDTINKKKTQRKERDSRKLISVCSFETKV